MKLTPLIHPETGELTFATASGVEALRAAGYKDVAAPKSAAKKASGGDQPVGE